MSNTTIDYTQWERGKDFPDFFDEVAPDYIVKSLKEAMDVIINCDC